jgi:hypothetical protein
VIGASASASRAVGYDRDTEHAEVNEMVGEARKLVEQHWPDTERSQSGCSSKAGSTFWTPKPGLQWTPIPGDKEGMRHCMPRPRQRACLESGLKLDINKLVREGLLRPGAKAGPYMLGWTNSYTGELTASGLITIHLLSDYEGWFRIQIGELDQGVDLVAQPRHFGGRQWYFKSPVTGQCCSALWMPPGARRFASRQAWGRHVAYVSQFDTPVDRAHRGKAKIKARLIGTCDPDEWDLPPKPKWMRWHTYNKQVDKFDRYEGRLDALCRQALMRILRKD